MSGDNMVLQYFEAYHGYGDNRITLMPFLPKLLVVPNQFASVPDADSITTPGVSIIV